MATKGRKKVKKAEVIKEQKEARKLEKSIAKNHAMLSLGLFATAMLVYVKSLSAGWVPLVVIGGIFMLSSLYFLGINRFMPDKKRRKIINEVSFARINHIEWFLGFVAFGVALIQTVQTNWAAITGIICIIVGYAVLAYGVGKLTRLITEEAKMGSKGRKNVKKPKQKKEKK